MSYRGLGTVDPWTSPFWHVWSVGNVYVFRVALGGALFRDARDVLPFVKAFGQDQNLGIDVRGAGLWMAPDGTLMLDVVGTEDARVGHVPFVADTATDIANKMVADKELLASFPSLRMSGPVFGLITDPADAISHWQSMPILYDHQLGMTQVFAEPSEYSLFLGKADDGAKVVPWKLPVPGLGPAQPGPSVPGQVPPPAPKPGPTEADVVPWLIGAAGLGLVGLAGWNFWKRKR